MLLEAIWSMIDRTSASKAGMHRVGKIQRFRRCPQVICFGTIPASLEETVTKLA